MSPPRIAIVGAGLGGLTLFRGLQAHGIRAVIYDQAAPSPRHEYAITLSARTCTALLGLLKLDRASLEHRVGVERHLSPSSSSSSSSSPSSSSHPSQATTQKPLRAHRRRLEEVLRDGVDVQWRHALETVDLGSGGNALTFKVRGEGRDGGSAATTTKAAATDTATAVYNYVVAADGVHSAARRALLPTTGTAREPTVLPYVALNGKRRVPVADFEQKYSTAFRDAGGPVIVRHVGGGTRLLQIDVFDRTADGVSISWIYSRRAAGDGKGNEGDELFAPNRPKTAATEIPEAFYREIDALGLTEQPFADVFDSAKLRGERTLSWLMRTTEVGVEELRALAGRGVLFVGDAVHAEPILGGEGANVAIEDGLRLADWVAEEGLEKNATGWYERRYPEWADGVMASKRRIEDMHAAEKAVL